MLVRDKLFIGGEWVDPDGSDTIDVISPATEEVFGRVPHASEEDVDRAGAAARTAFDSGPWPRSAPSERAELMTRVSKLLQGQRDELARLITQENGSPISFSVGGQVMASTMVRDYYTALAREYPFEELRSGMMGR